MKQRTANAQGTRRVCITFRVACASDDVFLPAKFTLADYAKLAIPLSQIRAYYESAAGSVPAAGLAMKGWPEAGKITRLIRAGALSG